MLILAGATGLRAIGRAVEKVEKAVTTGNPELPPAPPVPGAAKPGTPRELPRSGADDPRNAVDPDTGRPAPKAPPAAPTPAPAPNTQTLPGPSFDPNNRSFPPR
jgi:hypothetical protein